MARANNADQDQTVPLYGLLFHYVLLRNNCIKKQNKKTKDKNIVLEI